MQKWMGFVGVFFLFGIVFLVQHKTPSRTIGTIEDLDFPSVFTLPYHQTITVVLTGDRTVHSAAMLGRQTDNLWWKNLRPNILALEMALHGNGDVHITLSKGGQSIAAGVLDTSSSLEQITLDLEHPDALVLGENVFSLTIEGLPGIQLTLASPKTVNGETGVPKVSISEKLLGVQAITRWFYFSWQQSTLFCVVCFFLCCLAGKIYVTKKWIIGGVILCLAGYAFLPPVLSGYDETAHIDMFYRALKGNVKCIDANDCPHFRRVGEYMIENGFYNLHRVEIQSVDQPPHHVLKFKNIPQNSGVTDEPMNWYRGLAVFSMFFGVSYESPPSILSLFVRSFHFVSFTLLFLLCSWHVGTAKTLTMGMLLILNGALLGQIGSISNDIPFYWVGTLVGLALIRQIGEKKLIWSTVIVTVLATAAVQLLRQIDHSWIAFGPGLFFAVVVLSGRLWNVTCRWYLPICTILALAFGWLLLSNDMINQSLGEYMKQYSPRYNHIFALQKMEFFSGVTILKYHIASWLGSFVWGHSFYPENVMIALVILIALYLGGGWWFMHHDPHWKKDRFIIDGYFASVCIYVLLVLAISAPYANTPSVWVNAKVRFTALSSFLLTLPIGYVTLRMANIYPASTQVVSQVLFGIMSLLFGVYTLQFYFVDLL